MKTSHIRLLCLCLGFAALMRIANTAAGADSAVTCAAGKQKAAFKKALTRGICYVRAAKKGIAVDSECLLKVEEKFNEAFQRAEDKGGCTTNGDAPAVEQTVDAFVTEIVTTVAATTTTTPPFTCGGTAPACSGTCPPGLSCGGGGGGPGAACGCN